ELSRADIRVVVPRPAVFLKQHAHGSILELEAGGSEASILPYHRTCAGEHVHSVEWPASDVMRDCGEVATRGGEAHAERLGFGLGAPFDTPKTMRSIANGHAWMRTRQQLFNEFEWRIGNICRTAGSITKV